MSDSENHPSDSSDHNRPNKPQRRGGPKRPDKQPSSSLFWYLMLGGVLAAVLFSFLSNQQSGRELKFSTFYRGVQEGRFHEGNVHELTFGTGSITFQDRPPSGERSEEASEKSASRYYVPTIGISEDRLTALEELLDEKNIEYGGQKPPSEWQSLATFLILPVLFLLFFIFLFRRMGGAGTAMSFGRSRGKLYAQEDVQITFNDVAGLNEAVEELKEVVEFLKAPGKYQALGGRIPRGVLLVGPPGTGKTLLAKAVAGEAGVPFFGLSGSDFVEMFVGVGAARVRDMFQQAAQRSPAIVFIDELDALGKTRGSGMPGGHDEREQTLNALLVEMDGFSSDQSVIVMAATNRPETLDPALLRPGRFDRNVLADRPDIKGREEILKVHSAKIKLEDGVDLNHVARLSSGFVGADLANLVNEAALLAARRNKKCVTMSEFEEGIERVVAGLEKSSRIIHEDEKQRVAYHECGHALVACTLPNTEVVHKISIIPRGMGALGYTLQRPEDERKLVTQSELENRICVLLGGIAAEEVIFQETSTGAQNDLQRATDIARRMVTEFGMSPKLGRVNYGEAQRRTNDNGIPIPGEQPHSERTVREIDLEIKRIVDEAVASVHEILARRRGALDHMARELMEHEVMDADHLKRILDEYRKGPEIKPGTFAPPAGTEGAEPSSAENQDQDTTPRRESVDGA